MNHKGYIIQINKDISTVKEILKNRKIQWFWNEFQPQFFSENPNFIRLKPVADNIFVYDPSLPIVDITLFADNGKTNLHLTFKEQNYVKFYRIFCHLIPIFILAVIFASPEIKPTFWEVLCLLPFPLYLIELFLISKKKGIIKKIGKKTTTLPICTIITAIIAFLFALITKNIDLLFLLISAFLFPLLCSLTTGTFSRLSVRSTIKRITDLLENDL